MGIEFLFHLCYDGLIEWDDYVLGALDQLMEE